MTERKMKAYKADTEDSECQEIIFAYTAADAKKQPADVWEGCEFIERRVRRAPAFDDATQPEPTVSEYLARGWCMPCAHCERFVYIDGVITLDDEESGEPITDDTAGLVWCNQRCQDDDKFHQLRLDRRQAQQAA